LEEIKKGIVGKKIMVLGDMMLDGYFWGGVSRISPEAPVPVVELDEEFYRFGGAANVANNLAHLQTEAVPVGIIGDDEYGEIFKRLLHKEEINSDGILVDKTRPTTTKIRVIADKQHVVRIDKETKEEISEETEKRIIDYIASRIREIDAIILQDYNKGIFTKSLIGKVIEIANSENKIVTVDPKFLNFFEYKNVTVFKPNRHETATALGIKMSGEDDLIFAGKELLKRLNSQYVLLTLSEEGIALFEKGKDNFVRIPTKARKVADVSGAGDTVIATLTASLAAGATIEEAAYLANYAGGIVCEEVGIVPVELENLFNQAKVTSERK
jgi:rfaE bifunctional protein kinase chain/domain